MHHRWNNVLLAGLLTVVASGCAVEVPKTPKPANLILISLDALRADHLSSYGYHRRTTPFLDEIAAQGIRYSHATVNTHGTPPSHTTMLSSLYQETHRVGLGLTPGQPEAPLIPAEIELVRVPFILWGRDIPAGVVDPGLVSTIDIAPTLLGIAGVSPSAVMEGRNVLGPDPTPWREQRVFAQYGTAVYSIRTPSFKLIESAGGRQMLFDLARDPRERRNIAAEQPDLTAALAVELEDWRLARPNLVNLASSNTEIDPATEEQLKVLGYLD